MTQHELKQLSHLSNFFKDATKDDITSLLMYLQLVPLDKINVSVAKYTFTEILKEISKKEGKNYEEIIENLKYR